MTASRPLNKSVNLLAYTKILIKTLGITNVCVEAFYTSKQLQIYLIERNDISLFGPMPPAAQICSISNNNNNVNISKPDSNYEILSKTLEKYQDFL